MAVIGFVGLGQMGGPFSRNLLKAGHRLRVHDLSAEAMAAVVAAGGEAAASPREAAVGADLVFTSLPIGAVVEAAVLGPDGIAEGLAPGALYIDTSTVLPEETVRLGAALRARGRAMIEARVGRTSAHAEAGTSTFMVAGEPADIERARPILQQIGEAITVCGPLGAASTVKLINNYISAVINLATAEGLAWGLAAGVDVATIVEVISQTPAGRGHITTTWPGKALADDPSPAFMLDLASKDLGLALQAAGALRVPVGTGAAAKQLYAIAQARGHGREDWTTGIYRTLRELTGCPPRPGGAT
jgi:4-hydroxybutyrate dehydrogenase/sulfolactaldehyde 3-reductase